MKIKTKIYSTQKNVFMPSQKFMAFFLLWNTNGDF